MEVLLLSFLCLTYTKRDSSNNDDNNDDHKERSKEEAMMAFLEAGRSVETVPKDLATAIEIGRVPGSIVKRYSNLCSRKKSVLFLWLLQFGGFKERLLANDLFWAKVKGRINWNILFIFTENRCNNCMS